MEDLTFHLEGIVKEKNELQDFSGPLSLILMLLQKNKIEIRDIKISDILDQYLAYLAEMERMDLEIASEFVQMASHLLYIKTKTLLSAKEEVSELEELMSSLEQQKCRDIRESIQKIIPELKEASERGLLYLAKQPEPLPRVDREYEYRHEPIELFRSLYAVLTRGGKLIEPESIEKLAPARIVYEVRTKSREIIARLRKGSELLTVLYSECSSRSEIIATFISVLELCSMGSIRLESEGGNDYRLSFTGGDVNEILERIVE